MPDPLRGPVRRPREPLPSPGRTPGRGLDREGNAAVPVARVRLRPHHRPAARRLHRRPRSLSGRGPHRRHLRRSPRPAGARADRQRRHGGDARQLGHHPRVRDGRPLQPRLRRRSPPTGGRGRADLHRHPPRGGRRLRRLGLRQAHRTTGRLLRDRRPRFHQPAHRPLRRQARPGPRRRPLGPGPLRRPRARRLPGPRPHGGVRPRRGYVDHDPPPLEPRRADHVGREAGHRRP